MKLVLSLALLTYLCHAAQAGDSVDEISLKYEKLKKAGLINLYKRQYGELMAIRFSAMEAQNLGLANKADDQMKKLKAEMLSLDPNIDLSTRSTKRYPENETYRMVYHSGGCGTEKGHEIFCRFLRFQNRKSLGGTLHLNLATDPERRYPNTPNTVYILDGSSKEEVSKLNGLRKGKHKIPLKLSATDKVELIIVVKGNDCLHLKPFNDLTIPDLYLTVE